MCVFVLNTHVFWNSIELSLAKLGWHSFFFSWFISLYFSFSLFFLLSPVSAIPWSLSSQNEDSLKVDDDDSDDDDDKDNDEDNKDINKNLLR